MIAGDHAGQALAAVLEALSIPHATTVGDEETRNQILLMRVMHTVVFLEGLDQEDQAYVAESFPHRLSYFRERLAAYPAEGYKTWDELVAEMEARRERA